MEFLAGLVVGILCTGVVMSIVGGKMIKGAIDGMTTLKQVLYEKDIRAMKVSFAELNIKHMSKFISKFEDRLKKDSRQSFTKQNIENILYKCYKESAASMSRYRDMVKEGGDDGEKS